MIQRFKNDTSVSVYGVDEIIGHPQYNPRTYSNDIALLRLNDTVQFNSKVYPICLPTIQHDDAKAIVTGFGKTGMNQEQADNLQKVELEFFSYDECQKRYKRIKNINTKTMLCYGHHTERKDSCKVSLIFI